MSEQLKADVVVVGSGIAGPTAAVRALESGAKNVILLEARKVQGGNAVRAGGIFGVESPVTKRAGVNYTCDQAFIDKMNSVNWRIDSRVVRTLINTSGKVIEWLESKGLGFDLQTFEGDAREGHFPLTFHMPKKLASGRFGGEALVEIMNRECERLGTKVLFNTEGRKLITDESGKITGIIAYNKEAGDFKIDASAVIITAGGFTGNKELMSRFFPKQVKQNIFSFSIPYKGYGLLMAEEIGAIIDDCVCYYSFAPHHYPYAATLRCMIRHPEPIWINKFGQRFVDESMWLGSQHHCGAAVERQPDAVCYALMDSETLEGIRKEKRTYGLLTPPIGKDPHRHPDEKLPDGTDWKTAWVKDMETDFKIDHEKGVAKICQNLDEVAEFAGADPEAVKETVQQYNSYCNTGYDADFIKPKKYLRPISKPPFYVWTGFNGFDVTFGGIKVNDKMQVINKNYKVIPGLFAGGNSNGGTVATPYHTKFAGSSMGFSTYSGFIAGTNAGKYVSGK
jgi:fumarate reductase flavoprotein subunit